MLEFGGKILTVKCDCCGKEESAPESIGIVHFAGEGWSLFQRNENGELVQYCEKCAKAPEVIDVDEMMVV